MYWHLMQCTALGVRVQHFPEGNMALTGVSHRLKGSLPEPHAQVFLMVKGLSVADSWRSMTPVLHDQLLVKLFQKHGQPVVL